MQNILNFRQLVLAMARGVADAAADLARRKNNHGDEQQQDPGKFPPRITTTIATETKVKNCCRSSDSTRRHGVLHALNVVDDGGEQCASGVFGKKCGRAAQQGGVEIVAQIGDHAETGVIHQVGPGVVADAFENCGSDQRKSHDGPGIGEMRGNELLQVDWVMRAGNTKN